MSIQPLLEVRNLRVSIRTESETLTIVDDVSLELRSNEVLCVVGESGSGKSVTMLSVMRLLDERAASYEGSVRFEGDELLTMSAHDMRGVRGSGIAMIFQDPMTALNPVYRIGWQIAEQIRAHSDVSRGQAREQTLRLLTQVGISDPHRRIDDYPHELSGGMRQRVMIALALSCRPRILIADEPTTALDVTVQSQILQLIADLKEETGMAVVLVTHDMGVVADVADRVQVMYGGRIVEQGPADEIFNHPQHPYTQGLLASIPRLDQPRPRRLPSIAGVPASAGRVAAGCVFAARCPHRFEPCGEQPGLRVVDDSPGHQVACHLLSDRSSNGAERGSDA
jgi:peptide/nickel transport system ATP-binding protein